MITGIRFEYIEDGAGPWQTEKQTGLPEGWTTCNTCNSDVGETTPSAVYDCISHEEDWDRRYLLAFTEQGAKTCLCDHVIGLLYLHGYIAYTVSVRAARVGKSGKQFAFLRNQIRSIS